MVGPYIKKMITRLHDYSVEEIEDYVAIEKKVPDNCKYLCKHAEG